MATALIVIDVQRGLLDDPPGAFEADVVLARINSLASRARSAGVPVIFVQHERVGTSLERGCDGWQFHDDVVIEASDRVVAKTTPDSFLNTALLDTLRELDVDRLVVCGYATEFCVDTTVRRAAALGFAVTLVSDGHTTHDKPHAPASWIRDHHNATLVEIVSFGPTIATAPARDVTFGA